MADQNIDKPGARLRLLREQRGLTVEDISEKTLISLGKLKLLEADRYSEVGIDLFVSGYIKKYSRIVGGDGDQLVTNFLQISGKFRDDDVAEVAPALENFESNIKHSTFDNLGGTKTLLGKIAINKAPIWLVAVILVVLWAAISFFVSDESSDSEHVDTSADMLLESSSDGVLDDMDVNSDELSDPEVSSVSTLVETSSELPVTKEKEQNNVASEDSIVETITVPALITSTPTVGVSNVESSSSVETETKLIFSFSDDCWISIKDGKGETLFAQLQGNGDNLQLAGVGPFDIQLGNARAAALRVNGEVFTIPIKVGHKTLRFSVTP